MHIDLHGFQNHFVFQKTNTIMKILDVKMIKVKITKIDRLAFLFASVLRIRVCV